ncbi:hypothetical protein KKB73_01120 [Patescibacteria group bacterium]|nr:hypothetical protein [Patescibacteria group bacterium]
MPTNKKLIYGILVVVILVIAGWWILSQQKSGGICGISDPLYCENDSECICTQDAGCFLGNKNYYQKCINKAERCADWCTGWSQPPVKCISNQCTNTYEVGKVTIATNKTEYSQGENVSANTSFAGKIHVFSNGAWLIYRLDNSSWNKIAESIGCSSYPDCGKINFDEIEDCSFPMCEAPACVNP